MFLNFCHVFNFDCGFIHVSHIWPDTKFHDELNGSCYKEIGSTTIELSTIFIKVCKVPYQNVIFMASFGLTI